MGKINRDYANKFSCKCGCKVGRVLIEEGIYQIEDVWSFTVVCRLCKVRKQIKAKLIGGFYEEVARDGAITIEEILPNNSGEYIDKNGIRYTFTEAVDFKLE